MRRRCQVLLVGSGRMGRALLDGWVKAELVERIVVVDPGDVALSSVHGISCKSPDGIPADFKPDVVVLAVKPQIMADVLPAYARYAGQALFLSIAAGKTIGFFERILGKDAAIVRAMPNLPASIGQGATVAVANSRVNAVQQDLAAALLGAVGFSVFVADEGQLDAVTALSGSGPAYLFLLTEVLGEAGAKLGLAPDLAAQLARATVIGSAGLLADQAAAPPADLRRAVTSPGGTTEAALAVLMAETGMRDLFQKALQAAAARAHDLSE